MATVEMYHGYPLWHYVPSIPAAVIFIAIFSLATAGHTWRMVQYRVWFGIPMVVGGVFEIVGYVGRAIAHGHTGELMPYVMQSTLLLLAPVLFAASLYMTLSRVIVATSGQKHSPVAPRWLTRIFVFGDIFSFIVQGSGAGLLVRASGGTSDTDPKLGSNIIVGGLILQLIIFGIFILTTFIFNKRFRGDTHAANRAIDIPWQQSLTMLYITSAFIMIRNIFRVVEYVLGNDGYLLSVEWAVYVFDAALMSLTMLWYLWRYPHKVKIALRFQRRLAVMEECELTEMKQAR